MKKFASLLLALCLMAGCSSQPVEETPEVPVTDTPSVEAPAETPVEETIDYPALEVSDLSSMNLVSAENETLRISYPEELFTYSADSELFTLLLNEDPSVNIQVIKDIPLPGDLDLASFENLFASALESVKNTELLTVETADLYQLNEQPIFYIEYSIVIDDAAIDALLANGTFTQEMIDQAGGREAVKDMLPPIRTAQIGAIVDDYLMVYTGGYSDEAHQQTLIDAMAVLFANTEVLN